MRLLCSGDLHLGRRSSRVPASLAAPSAADVWQRVVRAAEQHAVDAVLLSGDLVDQDNRYFEAIGPLERGLATLHAAGIPVIAVTGNHDHDVLPALHRTLPAGHLTLLGVGGRWEHTTLTSSRGERLHVLGWSFPDSTVRQSPLDAPPPPMPADAPIIGVVHGDLDAPGSVYAPLARSAFARWPAAAWLLGHVHVPRWHDGAIPLLYPGSPQPLDPGETGVHGAWLVEMAPGAAPRAQLLPLASVLYDTVPVPLETCHDLADARDAAVHALRRQVRMARRENEHLAHVAARVRFVGRTALHGTLAPLIEQLRSVDALTADDETPIAERGAITSSVTHVHDETQAPRDLASLAGGRDAIGVLAQLLLHIEQGHADAIDPALWRAARAVPTTVERAKAFAGLRDEHGVPDAMLRARLARQADRLLDALLRQREART
jgi:DNA repair protein SbcD/Mre11